MSFNLYLAVLADKSFISKDHTSVQINIDYLDGNGQITTFALCCFVRVQGNADSIVDRLW
ncbi:40S ribosomal protein [Salix suchowensis]|nr:40S ribosomal protein [Salix suchowensis]